MSTRCACPTLICGGAGAGIPASAGNCTSASSSRTLLFERRAGPASHGLSTPPGNGFRRLMAALSAVMGLCGMSAISLPRRARSCFSEAAADSVPRSTTSPETRPPRHGNKPSSDRTSVLLPAPLEPTRPSTSPRCNSNSRSRRELARRNSRPRCEHEEEFRRSSGPLQAKLLDVPHQPRLQHRRLHALQLAAKPQPERWDRRDR